MKQKAKREPLWSYAGDRCRPGLCHYARLYLHDLPVSDKPNSEFLYRQTPANHKRTSGHFPEITRAIATKFLDENPNSWSLLARTYNLILYKPT